LSTSTLSLLPIPTPTSRVKKRKDETRKKERNKSLILQAPSSVVAALSSLCLPLILGGGSLFYSKGGRRSQPEQDVVDERDRQGDEHAKNDSASTKQRAEEKMVSNRAPVSAATGEENL